MRHLLPREALYDVLGVPRARGVSLGVEAQLAAGRCLSDVDWWRALSPSALAYVARRLGDAAERAAARELPVGKRVVARRADAYRDQRCTSNAGITRVLRAARGDAS